MKSSARGTLSILFVQPRQLAVKRKRAATISALQRSISMAGEGGETESFDA
jgi:hypothetical protein